MKLWNLFPLVFVAISCQTPSPAQSDAAPPAASARASQDAAIVIEDAGAWSLHF